MNIKVPGGDSPTEEALPEESKAESFSYENLLPLVEKRTVISGLIYEQKVVLKNNGSMPWPHGTSLLKVRTKSEGSSVEKLPVEV